MSPEMIAQVIQETGSAQVQCAGQSMEPTIARGDSVTVERCDRPRVGDVVLFRTGDHVQLHRVLWCSRRLGRFAHVGDLPGAAAGIASLDTVIGRARVPRRRPSLSQQWSGVRCVAAAVASKAHRRIG